MKRRTRTLLSTAIAGSCLALAVPATPASALNVAVRITGRASVLPGGVEPAQRGHSSYAHVSGNGRYIAFSSGSQLVPEDKDTVGDVYVKDLLTDQLERIDVTKDGKPATSGALAGAITPDGRYVVFASKASNLVTGATGAKSQVFVRDRKTKTTELVSVSSTEVVGNGNSPVDFDVRLDISDDGRYVAFGSLASNLGPDADTVADIFVRDRQAGTTSLVSVSTGGASTTAASLHPTMSANGRYIAFDSYDTNLVAGDTNAAIDVFVRDRQTTTTTRVSLYDNDTQAPKGGSMPSMDDSGTKIAFTASDKLNAIDPNSTSDVFVRDTVAGATTVGSVAANGWAAGESSDAAISGDGSTVAFASRLAVSDGITNDTMHLYLRRAGTTTRETIRTDGLIVAGDSYGPSLSSNGQVLAFHSDAVSLVPGDSGMQDVFFRRWVGVGPFGDETAFVQRQLFDFVGDASPGQVTAPKAAIDAGASPEHWLVGLASAKGFAGRRPEAIRLYAAYFNRLPDKGGLTYWVNKLEGGMPLDKVSASFAASNEFTTKYGNTTNTQFVTLVYQNVLERSPDAAGLQFWVTKLDGGMSRGTVMTNFSESSEGKRFMQPEVTATLLGLGMLDAVPTGPLLSSMLLAARNDSPEAAAAVILDSAAYKTAVS